MKPISIRVPTEHLSRYDRPAVLTRTTSPSIDQQYQTTIEASASSTSSKHPTTARQAAALRSFRQLGASIDDQSSRWSVALDFVVFGLVTGLVAWSLISLLVVLAQTAPG